MSLVAQIESIERSSNGASQETKDELLRELVEHTQRSIKQFKHYLRQGLDDKDYESRTRVMLDNVIAGVTTFKQECESMGVQEFLKQAETVYLLGGNFDITRGLEVLDSTISRLYPITGL
jgi:hypothetical protein